MTKKTENTNALECGLTLAINRLNFIMNEHNLGEEKAEMIDDLNQILKNSRDAHNSRVHTFTFELTFDHPQADAAALLIARKELEAEDYNHSDPKKNFVFSSIDIPSIDLLSPPTKKGQ